MPRRQVPVPAVRRDAMAGTAAEDDIACTRRLPEQSMKPIVTSPPYNIGKRYERRTSLERCLSGQTAAIAECVRSNHVEKTGHPCRFPVELVERLVLAPTEKGDAVPDPYKGVGSTVLAAVRHGRRAFGCDAVPRYVEIARERRGELLAGTLRTRPMGKPVYDPALPRGGH